jgi:hypothetical protein
MARKALWQAKARGSMESAEERWMRNVKKWCGWRGSNPRPLASEVGTADRVSETVSLDFQWFCGATVCCLSGFRKTH